MTREDLENLLDSIRRTMAAPRQVVAREYGLQSTDDIGAGLAAREY